MNRANRTRARLREQFRDGRLDDRVVELDVRNTAMPSFELIAGTPVEEIGVNLKDMMGNMFQGRTKTRRLKVPDALEHLVAEEQTKLVDMASVSRGALRRVEQAGIIFIDEIDKIASRDTTGRLGPWSRRQPGGCPARYSPDRRGHDGQHQARKGQDRPHPVRRGWGVSRVEAVGPDSGTAGPVFRSGWSSSRSRATIFVQILTQPKNALIQQYIALIGTEDVALSFTPAAVERIADFATRVNEITENIGARRLHTVMERLLDELSFDASEIGRQSVTIDEAYVDRMLADIVKNEDLSRYIL